ncbi:response regulator [Mahella australiensis]|uniref:Stage 0 sporulation protein A homolog n=1 Tax=Mahella australiensis (strain DSM 15567 / CIP 107919 / 50-1 BON) TaxID=697281 RepID=F3ZYP7_MAHA5|nr:response regulator [Mahella australiensis]AEE97815.1 two component transcriptional regulator, AraC family [Mahella australiensis 50-1 BON]
MPYKIIIVDDEDIVREGLANFVDWQAMGFEVVAQFADGKQALEYVEKASVDVVLTDIKMTFVSGLDLAKYIYENKLDIKVVLISGYKEFDFARQAVDYKVEHYLLKPIAFNEITRVFRQIKAQLDEENERERRIEQERRQYQEIIPILQEQLFTDIITGVLTDKQEIERRMRLCKIDINPESNICGLILLEIIGFDEYIQDKWEYGKDGFYTAMHNFVRIEDNGIRCFPVYNIHNYVQMLVIATYAMDEASFKHAIEDTFESVKQGIKAIFGLETTVKLQYVSGSLFELSSGGRALLYTHANEVNDYDLTGMLDREKLFVSCIEAGDSDGVSNLFNGFLSDIKDMGIKKIRSLIIELFATIRDKLKDAGIDMRILDQGGINYDTILLLDDVDKIHSWGQNELYRIVELVRQVKKTPEQNTIEKAKRYINRNYNKDISLENVADHVFLNPVYFSRFFKQQTGENFIDYLVRVRMEKAKEMLRDPRLKVHEISEMAGYKNTRYFSKLFKAYTGFTPSEFRSNILRENRYDCEQ